MAEKKKKSYLFTKILLVSLLIFLGLVLYAYKMIEDDKANSYKNRTMRDNNTPMPHPPLTQRDTENVQEEIQETSHETVNTEMNVSLEKSENVEKNESIEFLEGAEYISEEERLAREANLSLPQEEPFSEGDIIPADELHKYKEAETIPLNETEEKPTASKNPFDNISLGTPISQERTTNEVKEHPSLGTPIGDSPLSPF